MASNFYEALGMISAKMAKFWEKKKQSRMGSDPEILTTFNDNPDLLKTIITADESWAYGCDIETKAQSS